MTAEAHPKTVLDHLFARDSLRIALHGIHDAANPARVIGYEALMRGPRGTPYESPPMAFAMAATLDLLEELDTRCIELASTIATDGLLFLNAHPRTIVRSEAFRETIAAFSRAPRNVVFEVVEHSTARQDELLRALMELRALGFGSPSTISAKAQPACAAWSSSPRLRQDRPLLHRRHRPRPEAPRRGERLVA